MTYNTRRGVVIENEAAYEAAKYANIKANAAKTARKVWFAENEDAARLYAFLHGQDEFDCGLNGERPAIRFPTGGFGELLGQFRKTLGDWGKLSPKQTQIVRDALAKAELFAAERDVKIAAQREADAATAHVGTVGERRDFDLTVEKVLSFEGQYGITYINLCRDLDGNIVVYKGSNAFEVGPVRVKATIKAHDVREGVPQTLISRPKAL